LVGTILVGVLIALVGCTASPARTSDSQAVSQSASTASSAVDDTTVVSQPASTAPSAVDDTTVRSGEEWIAYQWDDEVFLIRSDGTGHHILVPDTAGEEIHPDWSPDGEQIAFVRFDPYDISELWVVDADGTDEQLLYRCELPCNSMDYPDWAPDGWAVYVGITANANENFIPSTFGVARVDAAGGDATWVVTREDGMTAEQPRISPDGTQVVYTRYDSITELANGSAIFVSDLAEGPEERLTDWEMWAAHADWSTEHGIVFNTFDLGAFQEDWWATNLYTMGTDGSNLTALTDFGEGETRATQPRWTPDGTGITFTQVSGGTGFGARQISFVGIDGSGMRSLTPDEHEGTHPQLRPVP
jgi:Tol biopolymer transport system component